MIEKTSVGQYIQKLGQDLGYFQELERKGLLPIDEIEEVTNEYLYIIEDLQKEFEIGIIKGNMEAMREIFGQEDLAFLEKTIDNL